MIKWVETTFLENFQNAHNRIISSQLKELFSHRLLSSRGSEKLKHHLALLVQRNLEGKNELLLTCSLTNFMRMTPLRSCPVNLLSWSYPS